MRKQLYLAVIGRLQQVEDENKEPAIKHFDLWNEQVTFIGQEDPFDLPAVFIEFLPIQWHTENDGAQTAGVQFRLHIVTPFKGSTAGGSAYRTEALALFDLLTDIHRVMFNMSGDGFRSTLRVQSDTNHNHEELIESIETYQACVSDRSACAKTRKVTPRLSLQPRPDEPKR